MKQALILASHGLMARETLNSARMIVQSTPENCGVVSVTEGKSYDAALEEMERLYEELDTSAGCLILTDIYGGTPANVATYLAMTREDILLYSGLNLPLVLELILSDHATLEELRQAIEELRPSLLVNVSEKIDEMEEDNGDQVDSY